MSGSTARKPEIDVRGRAANALLAHYVTPLEEVDHQTYLRCKKLEDNKIFKNARVSEVKYYIVTDPDALLAQPGCSILQIYAAWTVLEACPGLGRTRIKGKIYLWFGTIGDKHFNQAIAHELGHIVGTTADELTADKIASEILSETKTNLQ